MTRIQFTDLPRLEDLTPEQLKELFGAGLKGYKPSFEHLEDRWLMSGFTSVLSDTQLTAVNNTSAWAITPVASVDPIMTVSDTYNDANAQALAAAFDPVLKTLDDGHLGPTPIVVPYDHEEAGRIAIANKVAELRAGVQITAPVIGPSLGNPLASWGNPTGDSQPTADGYGRFQAFEGGSIYWSPATAKFDLDHGLSAGTAGAHFVASGTIRDAYIGKGTGFGYPVDDTATAKGWTSSYNDFLNPGTGQVSTIVFTPSSGANPTGPIVVSGHIRDKWLQLGDFAYGRPVAPQFDLDRGATFQDFEWGGPGGPGATIVSSPDTGTHDIVGKIRIKVINLGGLDNIGLPTTDNTIRTTTGNHLNPVVHFRNFVYADLPSRFDPHDSALGITGNGDACLVTGDIYTAWYSDGAETNLGTPTHDEQRMHLDGTNQLPGGTYRVSTFLSPGGRPGAIYWAENPDTWRFFVDRGDGRGVSRMFFTPTGGPTGRQAGDGTIGTVSSALQSGTPVIQSPAYLDIIQATDTTWTTVLSINSIATNITNLWQDSGTAQTGLVEFANSSYEEVPNGKDLAFLFMPSSGGSNSDNQAPADTGLTALPDVVMGVANATGTTVGATAGLAVTDAVATFASTDPNASAGDFSATILWDADDAGAAPDENVTIAYDSVNQVFTISGSYPYSVAGTHDVLVSIRQADGVATEVHTVINVSAAAASTLAFSAVSAATAGETQSVAVTALDEFGNIATGYAGTLHFSSSDSQAELPADYTFTDADQGVQTFSVTLKTAGNQTLAAIDENGVGGTQADILVTAANAASVSIAAPASAVAGTAQNVTVTALDAFGNAATGYLGTVHFSSSDSHGVLPTVYTFTADDQGVHTFAVTLKTAGSRTIMANDAATDLIAGANATMAVTAAAATHVSMKAPAEATAGVKVNVTATAFDAFGNVALGYHGTMHFTSSDSHGVLPANYTFVAGDHGVHTFAVTFKTAGSQTVMANDTTAAAIAGTKAAIAVTAAAATHLGIKAPAGAAAGVKVNVAVTAFDAFGNVATGYRGAMHFASSDVHSVLPANYTFVAGDHGVHTFAVTLKTAGSQSIKASDAVSPTVAGTQAAIAVTAAAATRFGITVPAHATAGSKVNVTVTAFDAFGNAASGYHGAVHFSSSDSHGVLPAVYTFVAGDHGVHTFAVTFKTAGSQTVSASRAIASAQAATAVASAAASHFVLTGLPSAVGIGIAQSFTITARDAFGNIVTGYVGTMTLTSSDKKAVLPAKYTFKAGDKGVHVFSLTFKTAGLQTVAIADAVVPALTGKQAGITVR